jgi:hypothetical protein
VNPVLPSASGDRAAARHDLGIDVACAAQVVNTGIVVVNGYQIAVKDLPALQRQAFPMPVHKDAGR